MYLFVAILDAEIVTCQTTVTVLEINPDTLVTHFRYED